MVPVPVRRHIQYDRRSLIFEGTATRTPTGLTDTGTQVLYRDVNARQEVPLHLKPLQVKDQPSLGSEKWSKHRFRSGNSSWERIWESGRSER